MIHLLAFWRWEKLLSDDATEYAQRLLEMFRRQRFPKSMEP
jgi:hypothetical protein